MNNQNQYQAPQQAPQQPQYQAPQQPQYQAPQQPPQQPQYQAPQQPQQPQYQPPQYQPQYQPPQYQAPKKPSAGLGGIVDLVIKLLPIFIVTFLGLAAVGFLYYFIMSIVDAAEYESFRMFLSGFAGAVATVAKYGFYAGILAVLHKILNKK